MRDYVIASLEFALWEGMSLVGDHLSYGDNLTDFMVGRLGIEPRTNGLKGHCSTIELPTRLARWLGKQNGPRKARTY